MRLSNLMSFPYPAAVKSNEFIATGYIKIYCNLFMYAMDIYIILL